MKILKRPLRKFASAIPNQRWRYRLLHWIHLNLEDSEAELLSLTKFLPKRRRCAVDVGANVGHYSAELSKYFGKVVAFEINDELTEGLRATYSNVDVRNIGLSSIQSDAILYIPLLHGKIPLVGWASLTPGNCPDTAIHAEKPVKIDLLDSFHLTDVDFIKIDVEGHELEVLKGARKTLETYSPALFIEVKEKNILNVRGFLKELGYVERSLEPLIGSSSSENHFFEVGTT